MVRQNNENKIRASVFDVKNKWWHCLNDNQFQSVSPNQWILDVLSTYGDKIAQVITI